MGLWQQKLVPQGKPDMDTQLCLLEPLEAVIAPGLLGNSPSAEQLEAQALDSDCSEPTLIPATYPLCYFNLTMSWFPHLKQ